MDGGDAPKRAKEAIKAAFARRNEPKKVEKRRAPDLLPENVLAWDVQMAMLREGGSLAVAGFGGVMGFRLDALQFVFEVMVPRDRWREVFEKFQVLRPYALQQFRTGGRDGKRKR